MFTAERRVKIFFLLALLFGLISAYLFWKQAQDLNQALGGMTTVYVAAVDIAAREPMTEKMVHPMKIPNRFVTPSNVLKIDDLVGNISLVPLKKEEWISKSTLKPANFLENARLRLIPFDEKGDGKLYIDPYLKPLDRADLIISHSFDGKPKTEIFRTDLEVVDIQSLDPGGVVPTQGQKLRRVLVSVPIDVAPELLHVIHYAEYIHLLKAESENRAAE